MNNFVSFMKSNAKAFLDTKPALASTFYVANILFFEKDEYQHYDVNLIAYAYLMSDMQYRDEFITVMYDKFNELHSKPGSTFMTRLTNEYNELNTKIDKLQCFLESEHDVSVYQEALLQLQLSIMQSYSKILRLRIDDLLTVIKENKDVNGKSNKRK